MNFSDWVAATGGQWGYENSADVNIPSSVNHENFSAYFNELIRFEEEIIDVKTLLMKENFLDYGNGYVIR